MPTFTTLGAAVALAAAIVLIFRKVPPVYALFLGALAGGLCGGGGLEPTVKAMVSGAQGMMPAVLRILASGVLAGALVKTGSAERMASGVVGALGERFALAAIALATALVCATGVFVDISVITVAPVALAVGRRANLPVPAILLAMTGGGKAGNIVSPNPNTIAVAESFGCDLTSLMAANAAPAICALAAAILLAGLLGRREGGKAAAQAEAPPADLPPAWAAWTGPATVVALLSLRPLLGVAVDPLVALPAGGIASVLAARKWRDTVEIASFGLGKVAGVALLLVGTGTIAGIIKDSSLTGDTVALLEACRMPAFLLAPLSGVLMAGATASTTAGATVASQSFSAALLNAGVPALSAAAMIHAGATVVDSLPHGSFFHATGGVVFMPLKERMRLIPWEAAVGLCSTLVSMATYLAKA